MKGFLEYLWGLILGLLLLAYGAGTIAHTIKDILDWISFIFK